jgi:hypothetical protein
MIKLVYILCKCGRQKRYITAIWLVNICEQVMFGCLSSLACLNIPPTQKNLFEYILDWTVNKASSCKLGHAWRVILDYLMYTLGSIIYSLDKAQLYGFP